MILEEEEKSQKGNTKSFSKVRLDKGMRELRINFLAFSLKYIQIDIYRLSE